MNKMTWILIWGVIALVARTTTAIKCYACNSIQLNTCGEPFYAFATMVTCPAGMNQCSKAKLNFKGASEEETYVERGCAPETATGCQSDTKQIHLPDGTPVQATGDLCLCSDDLCNDGEKFQPKMKLLMMAMATALMSIFFN